MATTSLATAAATLIAAEKAALEEAVAACDKFVADMTAAADKLADIPLNYNSPARSSINMVTQNLIFPMQEVKNRLQAYQPPTETPLINPV